MIAALVTEALKLRRSRLWWITIVAFTVAAGVGGLFMFIGQDPQRARSLGLLGAKAELAGIAADWAGYLALLAQIVAVGGLVIFGVLTIWIFGREFSDHTVKDLLALPTRRTTIVAAKFAVAAVWCLTLAAYLFALGLVIGAALRLPGWSGPVAVQGAVRLLATAAMTVSLAAVFGLAASVGRGYLAAIGVLFAAVFFAQVIAALGYGVYFPFSVPALFSGVAGPSQPSPTAVSYLLVLATGGAATVGTAAWWRAADQPG